MFSRPYRVIHSIWPGPGLAAADSNADQEVPSHPERLEEPARPAPASCSLCGSCYGPGFHQERRAPLSWAGAEPCSLQRRAELLFLQVRSL